MAELATHIYAMLTLLEWGWHKLHGRISYESYFVVVTAMVLEGLAHSPPFTPKLSVSKLSK